MRLPAFGHEDGTNITEWLREPDPGGSNPFVADNRIRYEIAGSDRFGRPVFNFVVASKNFWTFRWSAISATFFTSMRAFVNLRRCLFYPDADNSVLFYRVKIRETRMPAQAVSELYSTSLSIEQF